MKRIEDAGVPLERGFEATLRSQHAGDGEGGAVNGLRKERAAGRDVHEVGVGRQAARIRARHRRRILEERQNLGRIACKVVAKARRIAAGMPFPSDGTTSYREDDRVGDATDEAQVWRASAVDP